MTIKQIETELLSGVEHCPFCGEVLSGVHTTDDRINQKETTLFEYHCNAGIKVYKESNKTLQINIESHCSNQIEALRRIINNKTNK